MSVWWSNNFEIEPGPKFRSEGGITFREEMEQRRKAILKARPELEGELETALPTAPQTGPTQPVAPSAGVPPKTPESRLTEAVRLSEPTPLGQPLDTDKPLGTARLDEEGRPLVSPRPGRRDEAFIPLEKGSKDSFRVKVLQSNLKKMGYDVSVDGIFGGGTQDVLRQFQEDANLPVDGVYRRSGAEFMASAPEAFAQTKLYERQDPRGEANEHTRGYEGGGSSNVDALIGSVFVGEGGYSTDRADTGNYYKGSFVGTNHGISAPVLATYLGRKPTVEDMKNLTKADAAAIYKKNYVTNFGIDLLPVDLQEIVFHSVVNGGTHGLKVVQGLIGVPQTGRLDPATKEGMRKATFTKTQFKDALLTKYKGFRTWGKHGTGWTNRFTHLAKGTYLTEEPKGGGPRFIAGTDQNPEEKAKEPEKTTAVPTSPRPRPRKEFFVSK